MKLKDDFEILRKHFIIIRRDYNTYNNLFFSGNDDILGRGKEVKRVRLVY